MKRHNAIEALPELFSEFLFVALLAVGVTLFFLWVTRSRPRRAAPAPVAATSTAGRSAGGPAAATELDPFEELSLSA